MSWPIRRRPLRFSPAAVVLGLLLAAVCGVERAAPAAQASPQPAPLDPSKCPEAEVVWAISAGFVPSAASELLAARSRVDIKDLGAQYRVQVTTSGGVLERIYTDPARDCARRARFVAEFILVALLPPHLAAEEPPLVDAPAAKPTPSPPPAAQQPEAAPIQGARSHILQMALGALGTAAPAIFGSPSVIALGIDVRLCFGSGPIAAIAGVGYVPRAGFALSDLHGNVMRVPGIVGLRARASSAQFEIAGDLGIALAIERYVGTSPKMPRDATRFAPGIEGALVASTAGVFGLAPFASLRCAIFPFANDLGTTPEGVLGKTPSLWLGAVLGLSFAL